MKKNIKWLSVAVAASLTATMVLTGCNKTQNSASTATTKTNTAAPAQKLEPVKLRLFSAAGPAGMQKDQEPVQAEINKYLKGKLNCELELNLLDWGTFNNKMPLILQSGEQVDITWANSGNFFNNVSKEAYVQLDELLEKHGKDIKANMLPLLLDGGKVNGKLYAIPVNKEVAENTAILFKKDIVDKYKFDLSKVKCYEDMEPIMETIKKSEPSLVSLWVGGSSDKIPSFTTRYGLEHKGEAVPVSGLNMIQFNSKTGKFVNKYENPAEIEKLKLFRKWFEAGYLNKDGATTKTKPSDALKAGKVWTIGASGTPGSEKGRATELGTEFVKMITTEPKISTNSVTGSLNVIPRSSKDPDRMMMVLNLLHTDKTFNNLFHNGLEGKHYTKISDNVIKLPAGITKADDRGYNPGMTWMFGNVFLNYLWENEDPKKWDLYKEYNNSAVKHELFGFIADQTSLKTEVAALNNVLAEYEMVLESGSVNPEEVLKRMNEKFKANGIEKVIAEVQKQYDTSKAAKK